MRTRVEPMCRPQPVNGRALAGPLGRGPRSRLRTLAYEITVAEARERERIALGLHDEIGQFLTVARMKLAELRHSVHDDTGNVLLDEIAAMLAQASRATRSATFDLSSPVLRLGLEQALRSLADRLAGDSRLAVSFQWEVAPLALPEAVRAVVFRSVRELCLNVQKHAGAGHVTLTVRGDARSLRISVADDGVGFPVDASRDALCRSGGFGLASTQAQMQAIGGRLELSSAPGLGTRATLCLPLPA